MPEDYTHALALVNAIQDASSDLARAIVDALRDGRVSMGEGIAIALHGGRVANVMLALLTDADDELRRQVLHVLEHGDWVLSE